MGLTTKAKGLPEEVCFDYSYITYSNFIMQLIKTAYGERCYEMFRDSLIHHRPFADEEVALWDAHCNGDLDILIWHSDRDGKFSPQECRKIYNAMKNITMDVQDHDYLAMKQYNMLERWKAIFKHCADRRVNLYFC